LLLISAGLLTPLCACDKQPDNNDGFQLSQTLPAPGGSNNTDFGRMVSRRLSCSVTLQNLAEGRGSCASRIPWNSNTVQHAAFQQCRKASPRAGLHAKVAASWPMIHEARMWS
jgi:hypothetical protein